MIADAVITTDTDGTVTYLNPVAESLTGWSLADAQGRPLGQIYCSVDEMSREPLPDPVQEVIQRGTAVYPSGNRLLQCHAGHELPIEDSAAPMHDREGRLTGVVLVFRDVSHARRSRRSRWPRSCAGRWRRSALPGAGASSRWA